jgi:hypothetical protein
VSRTPTRALDDLDAQLQLAPAIDAGLLDVVVERVPRSVAAMVQRDLGLPNIVPDPLFPSAVNCRNIVPLTVTRSSGCTGSHATGGTRW